MRPFTRAQGGLCAATPWLCVATVAASLFSASLVSRTTVAGTIDAFDLLEYSGERHGSRDQDASCSRRAPRGPSDLQADLGLHRESVDLAAIVAASHGGRSLSDLIVELDQRLGGFMGDDAPDASAICDSASPADAIDAMLAEIVAASGGPGWNDAETAVEPADMPDWLRRIRLGIRPTAFVFYLSPSIPELNDPAAF